MKHHDPDNHLSDEEVLRAAVDPSDLDPARQAHLASCPQCRRQAEDVADDYRRLGQMARQMAPEPRRTFRLPADNAPAGRRYVRPALALGVLGTLVFAVTLWGPFTRMSQTPTPMVAETVEDDDALMAEIETLVEDALPEKYRQLAALPDDRSVEDLDEFIDWMVPSPVDTDEWDQSDTPDRESPREQGTA
mgnify:FL=1